MADWRIEEAPTDRSSCKQCGKRIAKGEQRFGNDSIMSSGWYHLGCAGTARPRVFAPFAKRGRRADEEGTEEGRSESA
ncbi:MAG: hypothetical protein QM831_43800 [Kofleriaceae bacterium]